MTWWTISPRNEAGEAAAPEEATSAELLVYSVVGEDMWEEDPVTAGRFAKELRALKNAKNIAVRINSPGGSVFDGNAIYNALKAHPAKVTTHIDGHALSIASVIALAGDEVVIAPNGVMMIHDPSAFAMGSAEDMRKTAEMLDRAKTSIIASYREKTGKTDNEISAAMAEEKWFDAKEAKEWGLVDRIENQPTAVAVASLAHDLEHLSAAAPKAFASFQRVPIALLGSQAGRTGTTTNNNEEDTMDPKTMAKALGLPETATEAEILARAEELATAGDEGEQGGEGEGGEGTEGEDPGNGTEGTTEPPATVQPATADGTVTVDAAAFADIKAKAERGAAVAAQIETQQRDAFIENAWKREGRFPEARAAHYTKLYNADKEGTIALINSLEKGLIPVDGQQSHVPQGGGDGTATDAYPADWLPELQTQQS